MIRCDKQNNTKTVLGFKFFFFKYTAIILNFLDYNTRRAPVYEQVQYTKYLFGSKSSSQSNVSSRGVDSSSETEELTTLSEIDNQAPLLGGSNEWLNDDPIMCDHSYAEDGSLPSGRGTFSSIETVQSAVELENGCNVILQGRIGQVEFAASCLLFCLLICL